ncbi:MAG: BMC domain-containing protein [Sporomusa sp.]
MVKNALGLIEVVGLAAGMEAADAAVKAANVEFLGYELTKGGGLIVIKLFGDVGAVKAAVDAAAAAAGKINKVYATHVIPRPQQQLSGMIITPDTVGQSPVKMANAIGKPDERQTPADAGGTIDALAAAEEDKEPITASVATEGCNLCGDPACPRKKGDARVNCLHFDNNKEDE